MNWANLIMIFVCGATGGAIIGSLQNWMEKRIAKRKERDRQEYQYILDKCYACGKPHRGSCKDLSIPLFQRMNVPTMAPAKDFVDEVLQLENMLTLYRDKIINKEYKSNDPNPKP